MDKERFLEFLSRMDIMKKLIKLNDPEKYHELERQDRYWTPETRPAKYSEWVIKNYEFDSDDALTLCIYSLLMNVPIKDLKEQMNENFERGIKR